MIEKGNKRTDIAKAKGKYLRKTTKTIIIDQY